MDYTLDNLDEGLTLKDKKKQKKKQEDQDFFWLEAIKKTTESLEARRVLWTILTRCKVFGSTFNPSGTIMAHNCGKQDLGHWILAEISRADQNIIFTMMTENQKGAYDDK